MVSAGPSGMPQPCALGVPNAFGFLRVSPEVR